MKAAKGDPLLSRNFGIAPRPASPFGTPVNQPPALPLFAFFCCVLGVFRPSNPAKNAAIWDPFTAAKTASRKEKTKNPEYEAQPKKGCL